MTTKLKSWNEIPEGGLILEAGNAVNFKTGDWRTFKPEVDKKKCINCLTCFVYCPDMSIKAKDGKMEGFDFEHCKGCGICAAVCPVKCIEMKQER